MGYQSKTWSLSDEVVEAVEAARERGDSPNRFFKRLIPLSLDDDVLAAVHAMPCSLNDYLRTALLDHPITAKQMITLATSIDDPTHLDATGPELSGGKGKATVETRGIRPKGDAKR